MISETELCEMIDVLETDALREWVEAGLVQTIAGKSDMAFDAADIARVRLICELRYDMNVEEETLPLVLSLIDQLYDMRRSMRAFSAAIEQQPADIRTNIMRAARMKLVLQPDSSVNQDRFPARKRS